jgi:hypothetical protein
MLYVQLATETSSLEAHSLIDSEELGNKRDAMLATCRFRC